MLAPTGALTPITRAIIAMAIVITVKDSVEAISRASANIPAMADGNLKQKNNKQKAAG